MNKILWLDTETTGLNKDICDIIQLSGIIVINGEEKERFNFHCQPMHYESIESEALVKNGLTIDTIKTFPLSQEVFVKFKQVLDKYIDKYNKEDKFYIAGHNVQFDIDFLKKFFKDQGDKFFGSYFYYKNMDLMALCSILHISGLFDIPSFKLGDIAVQLGIECDNLHDSVIDIDITRKCFSKLFANFMKF